MLRHQRAEFISSGHLPSSNPASTKLPRFRAARNWEERRKYELCPRWPKLTSEEFSRVRHAGYDKGHNCPDGVRDTSLAYIGAWAVKLCRDLSFRKGSALEPQRLPRRRFPLSTPFGVTGPMKARSRLAVRNFLPILPRDDRLTTEQTGGERIVDEAIANPGVDPLALVTDGGVGFRPTDGASIGDEATGSGSGSTAAACSSIVAGSDNSPSMSSSRRAPS